MNRPRIISVITATTMAAAVSIAVAAPASAWTGRDRAYVRAVRDDSPELRGVTARLLIKIARSSCDAMRTGSTPVELVYIAVDAGMDVESGIAITAGAAAFYCPDVSYLFDGTSA